MRCCLEATSPLSSIGLKYTVFNGSKVGPVEVGSNVDVSGAGGSTIHSSQGRLCQRRGALVSECAGQASRADRAGTAGAGAATASAATAANSAGDAAADRC